MAARFLNDGLLRVEQLIVGVQVNVLLKVKLWVNPLIVTNCLAYSDFVVCTAPGYSDITLVPANWTLAAPCNGTSTAQYPTITFDFTSNPENQSVYGYIMFEQSSSTVLWVDEFDVPFAIPPEGSSLPLNVLLMDSNVRDCDDDD